MTLNNQSHHLYLLDTEDKIIHARESKRNNMVKRKNNLQSCIVDFMVCKDVDEHAVVLLKVISDIDENNIGTARSTSAKLIIISKLVQPIQS